jgi:signal transduction histidine kinase
MAVATPYRLRFAPGVLAHLGELLVPAPEQALAELVKNAYDADATYCRINIEGGQTRTQRIVIEDDGDGMTERGIRDSWLVIGTSSKHLTIKTQRFQRIPLGAKGLGRLAALRLGRKAKLYSRPRDAAGRELILDIDWDRFDNARTIDETELVLRRRATEQAPGTTIILEELKQYLNADGIDEVGESLALLQGPFDKPRQFRIEINSARYGDVTTQTGTDYLTDADYVLRAKLSKQGTASYELVDWRGKQLKAGIGPRTYSSPPATFELWTFLLGGKSDATFSARTRLLTLRARREWLKLFGGVYVFEGPMRVSPYGGRAEDWLGLNLARTRSPEERPSTNNSVGRIVLSPRQTDLIQKTDRVGFIENRAFDDLKAFCLDAVSWMQKERLLLAQRRRDKRRRDAQSNVAAAQERVASLIDALPAQQSRPLERAIKALVTSQDEMTAAVQAELQLYRSLATVGMTTSTFAHELQKPLGILRRTMPRLERAVGDDATLKRHVQLVANSIDRLAPYITVPLGMLRRERRKGIRVNVVSAIADIVQLFEPLLLNAGIKATTLYGSEPAFVSGTPAMIDAILANLLANSLTAFERRSISQEDRRIRIRANIRGTRVILRYEDNGGGIKGLREADVWLPGITTTSGGTGFGLTIVRDTVKELDGTVSVLPCSEFGGALFTVELPLVDR